MSADGTGAATLAAALARPVFVDSNILIYAHDRSAGAKRERAREILDQLWELRAGHLSVQVLQEFFVNTTAKLGKPLAVADAREVVADLSHWHVHRPGPTDVLAAIDLGGRTGLSLWDAMIVQSAASQGCATLLSEDFNAGQDYEGATAVDPFDPTA